MNKRIKKKQQTYWLRNELYWYVKEQYNQGHKKIQINDGIRRYGTWWYLFRPDIKQVVKWLRKDGLQVQMFQSQPYWFGFDSWLLKIK